jgi:hypothetical protein
MAKAIHSRKSLSVLDGSREIIVFNYHGKGLWKQVEHGSWSRKLRVHMLKHEENKWNGRSLLVFLFVGWFLFCWFCFVFGYFRVFCFFFCLFYVFTLHPTPCPLPSHPLPQPLSTSPMPSSSECVELSWVFPQLGTSSLCEARCILSH